MFDLQSSIKNINKKYPTLILLRHAEKAEMQHNQPDHERTLTQLGKQTSCNFGRNLTHQGFAIEAIKTSAVKRCLETAEHIQNNLLFPCAITTCSLLGAPGAYVSSPKQAMSHFQTLSVREITKQLYQGRSLEGMGSLERGTELLLSVIVEDLLRQKHPILYISHDAILVPFITTVMRQTLPETSWIDYLQGIIVQYRAKNLLTICLESGEIEILI